MSECTLQLAACTVQSDGHPAANVLTRELYRAWQVRLANAGSETVEALASRADTGDGWENIVPKSTLRTQAEIKEGRQRERTRNWTTDNGLFKVAPEGQWKRLKVICSCKPDTLSILDHLASDGRLAQAWMGLSQLRVWSSLEVPAMAPAKAMMAGQIAKEPPAPNEPLASNKPGEQKKEPSREPKKVHDTNASLPNKEHANQAYAHTPACKIRRTAETPSTRTVDRSVFRKNGDKFSHWAKVGACAAGGGYSGSSASQAIRKTSVASVTAGAKSNSVDTSLIAKAHVQRELARRLADFVRGLPRSAIETTSVKDAKSGVMHFFENWEELWKTEKGFFKSKLEDLLNDALDAAEEQERDKAREERRREKKRQQERGSLRDDSVPCESAGRVVCEEPTADTACVSAEDPVREEIKRRISQYMSALPEHTRAESVTLRQLKEGVKPYFVHWDSVWAEHKDFFKTQAVRLLELFAVRGNAAPTASKGDSAQNHDGGGHMAATRACGDNGEVVVREDSCSRRAKSHDHGCKPRGGLDGGEGWPGADSASKKTRPTQPFADDCVIILD